MASRLDIYTIAKQLALASMLEQIIGWLPLVQIWDWYTQLVQVVQDNLVYRLYFHDNHSQQVIMAIITVQRASGLHASTYIWLAAQASQTIGRQLPVIVQLWLAAQLQQMPAQQAMYCKLKTGKYVLHGAGAQSSACRFIAQGMQCTLNLMF